MARIFISYSRNDAAFARKLATSLDSLGADIWIDVEDIPAGMKWSTAIQEGLDTCEVMIVVISPTSMESTNVEDEWQYYLDQGKLVVPALLRPAKVHFQLSRIQYIDFHNQDYATAFAQLCSELQRKGVKLGAPTVEDSSMQLPEQQSLFVRVGRLIPVRVIGVAAVVIAAVAALLLVSNSATLPGSTDTPQPTNTQQQSPGHPNPMQMTATALIASPTVAMIETDVETTVQVGMNRTLTVAAYTPTPDIVASQDARFTETAEAWNTTATQLANWTDTPLPTSTPTATPTPSHTPTNTTTNTPTDTPAPPGYSPDNPVTSNSQWEIVSRDFDGVEMVLVPTGCFIMGSDDGESDEQHIREKCFDEPFWIDREEVTNAQFTMFGGVAANASYWADDKLPRVNITWFEAHDFCELRGMRLPTEAEWEYAARGADNLIYTWGNDFDGARLNFCDVNCNWDWADETVDDGYQYTAPAGSYEGGISWVAAYDLSGNVWEWTSTLYQNYPYDENDGRESSSEANSDRVIRGGSWNNYVGDVRSANRGRYLPTINDHYVGFRCARDYSSDS